MIPETSAQQRVELYRAVDVPARWRREAVLLDGLIASDATLLEHEGRLWLFVGVAAPHATMLDELHLFTSELAAWAVACHTRVIRSSPTCAARAPGGGHPALGFGGSCARAGLQPALRGRGLVSGDRRAEPRGLRRARDREARSGRPRRRRARDPHLRRRRRFEAVDLRGRELRLGRARWEAFSAGDAGPGS